MEPIFVNKTEMNVDRCREFMGLTWGQNAKGLRIVLLILSILAIALGAYQLVIGWAFLYAIVLFLVAIVSLFLAFCGYMLWVGRYTREQQQDWGGKTLDKEVHFYKENFIQKTKLGEMHFNYSRVTRVIFGKTGIVLFLGSQAMMMDRWGFGDKETSEKFRQFIFEKAGWKRKR